jgi:hypothetical protein
MITIRSPKNISKPTLIGFEATLKTPHAVYEMSSIGSAIGAGAPIDGGLYGRIAWPRSIFRLGRDLLLEQQMFIPLDCSDAAISWQLRGSTIPAQLIIKPHFGGCEARNYRDRGFRREPQENGGRLYWLPHVLGPTIIADTNGQYRDEPFRFPAKLVNGENLAASVSPGTFQFHLTDRPSILILSTDGCVQGQCCGHFGMFLAGLSTHAGGLATKALNTSDTDVAGRVVMAAQ